MLIRNGRPAFPHPMDRLLRASPLAGVQGQSPWWVQGQSPGASSNSSDCPAHGRRALRYCNGVHTVVR
jgi:hypothetical protein